MNTEETVTGHLHQQQEGIGSTRVAIEIWNTVEMMESELPEQGSLGPNQEEQVGVHLVAHNEVIIVLNGMISIDHTG